MKKKLTAALAAGLMVLPFGTVSLTANATPQNVLLGDANSDGVVGISDAIYTQLYLWGHKTPTAYQITAMDANCDYVIDNSDILRMQQIEAGTLTAQTISKELYTVPDNSAMTYIRHDCSDNDLTSYDEYTLSLPASLSSFENDEKILSEIMSDRGSLTEDTVNSSTVKVCVGNEIHSGFIVSDHVIATAAKNIYSKSPTCTFKDNVSVQVYQYQNGNPTLAISCNAAYLHIPRIYTYIPSWTEADKPYDYALIYVNSDLSAYKANIGIALDEFMSTSSSVTVSGYNEYGVRQFSTGSVSSNFADNIMKISTESVGEMIGGQAYFSSNAFASAIGIIESSNTNIVDTIRITPTILRFYESNSYLTE